MFYEYGDAFAELRAAHMERLARVQAEIATLTEPGRRHRRPAAERAKALRRLRQTESNILNLWKTIDTTPSQIPPSYQG